MLARQRSRDHNDLGAVTARGATTKRKIKNRKIRAVVGRRCSGLLPPPPPPPQNWFIFGGGGAKPSEANRRRSFCCCKMNRIINAASQELTVNTLDTLYPYLP